jgi:hypothetical protein
LEENLAAATIDLGVDDLRQIHAALDGVAVQGDRYPAQLAARVGS